MKMLPRVSNRTRRFTTSPKAVQDKIRRASLFSTEQLENRILMSVASVVTGLNDLDLASAAGNSGTINGAVFTGATGHNTSGSGVIDSFVRLSTTGVEQGYNTAARPYSDVTITNDAGTTATFNHPIQIKDLPVVVRQQGNSPIPYFEFVLDLNQESALPYISLDNLQISTASSKSLTGYTTDGTYGNAATLVYDMHAGQIDYNAVAMNASFSTGSGSYDIFLNVPVSDFNVTSANDLNSYVYVYSQFGKQNLNDDIQGGTSDAKNGGSTNSGYEEWTRGVGRPVEAAGSVATSINEVTPTATTGVTSVAAGATVQDTATVTSNNANDGTPTGTVQYNFYNTATPIFGVTSPVWSDTQTLANGLVPPSQITSQLSAGSYSFIGVYSGGVTSPGGFYILGSVGQVEPLTVTQPIFASPTITTLAGGSVVLGSGSNLTDTSDLEGGNNPTGTITFKLFAPSDTTYTSPIYTDVVTVSGNGNTYSTANGDNPGGYLPAGIGTLTGTYQWLAVYSGDLGNKGVTSTKGSEPEDVTAAGSSTSTIIKDASTNGTPSGALGESLYDTATVTGTPAATPTGTLTYEFFTTLNGTGTHADQTVTLNADGSVPNSASTAALAAGSYSYIAIYSGDGNYTTSTGSVEPLTINQGTLTITTTIHNAADASVINVGTTVPVGFSVYDTASITGATAGFTPSYAAVSYTFTSNTVVTSAGSGAQSTTQGPLGGGSFAFQATFAGDSNYKVAVSAAEPFSTLTAEAGLTLGYYSNKNGENSLTGSTTGKTLLDGIYNRLFAAPSPANPAGGLLYNSNTGTSVLVDGKGHYEPLSFFKTYANVRTYLLNAKATNMAYMLSAQLLTTEFNVGLGKVSSYASIFVPMVTIPGSSTSISSTLQNSLQTHGVSHAGVAKVQDILIAAVAELKAAPYTVSSGSDRTFEEALKDLLDAINNNENIFVI
jgi:hypothetical protein